MEHNYSISNVFGYFAIIASILLFYACKESRPESVALASEEQESYWINVIDSMYQYAPIEIIEKRFDKIRNTEDSLNSKNIIIEIMTGVEFLKQSKFDKVEHTINSLDSLGVHNSSEFIQFEYYRLKYQFYDLKNNVELSAESIEKIREISNKTNTPYHHFFLMIAEGFQKKSEFNYHESLSILNQVIQEMEEVNYPRKSYLSKAYNGVGMLMYQLKKYDEAEQYIKKALEYELKANDLAGLARTYGNFTLAYSESRNSELSIEYLKKALEINEKIGRKSFVVSNNYNIGHSYFESDLESRLENALIYFTKGYELSIEIEYSIGIALNAFGLGRYYFEMKEYDKALPYLLKSWNESQKNQMKSIQYHVSNLLYQIEKHKGNLNSALSYLEAYSELEKLYYEHVKSKDVEELVIKHNVEKTEAENKHLLETLELNNTITKQKEMYFYIVLGVLLLVVLFTITLVRSYRRQKGLLVALNHRNEEVEIKNRALNNMISERDQLVKTIIHDLRNPLSAIKGCIDLVQNEKDEAELDMIVGMMKTSSRNLDVIISSLLISYSEQKNIQAERFTKVNIKSVLEKNILAYLFESKVKDINIDMHIEDFEAEIEQNAIVSILGNLLTNAIKYSPIGSNIHIEAKKLVNSWTLTLTDEGPGFSENDKKNMYAMFASMSAKPTGNEIKTGIGLFSVKKTIDMLNGKITLNDNYTNGAQFICEFPLKYRD